jgi:hypothetical protein
VSQLQCDEVGPLLDRFTADVSQVVSLIALWAHGSLALGDFQPGRSDLDLIALVSAGISGTQRRQLEGVHRAIVKDAVLGAKLHCSYVVRSELPDDSRPHLTWAGGRLFDRPVSPVSRRELCTGGLCLYGPVPAGLVPSVTDQELADFIRDDLRARWRPVTGKPYLWLRDMWVDLGLLTLARASVALDQGRLITKKEALDVLAGLGAPRDVLTDIHQRRYEAERPISIRWRIKRGYLARAFVRAGIDQILSREQQR